MALEFADFPQDILSELSRWLDAVDLLSFLATCRSARELRLQRSFWLYALERIRHVEAQPLPLSNADCVNTLSLGQLQDAVQRASRVMRAFRHGSSPPRPVRVHTMAIGREGRIFCIPGTHLAVSHGGGSVACWDILTSQRVAQLGIPGLRVRNESPCMEVRGKALVAACIGRTAERLVVICIDYRDRAHVELSHVVSPEVNRDDTLLSGFFINSQVMGHCTQSQIISWTMEAGAEVQRMTQHIHRPAGVTQPLCLAFGGSVYAFHEGSVTLDATIQRLSLPSTPPSDATHLPSTVNTLPFSYSFAASQAELYSHMMGRTVSLHSHAPHLLVPEYGVFAVTCRTLSIDTLVVPIVHFWAGLIEPDADGARALSFGRACFYEHGDPIEAVAVGSSGTYVLLLAQDAEDGGGYLGVLHFSAVPYPHTTFRKLVAGGLSVFDCRQLAIDDSLGLVLAVDSGGKVTVVWYA
ncbi:hypothetical protein GGX14DRAFT_594343 [Mycena pura]|uniref:F-box domain-containing protein n=1 Tax=Mycena pura TaxID=153505 RepID=A0AAD6XYD6_9AGAR|nr:hypothetical protein GGX14DRAFT_594343 [Mycena pura]